MDELKTSKPEIECDPPGAGMAALFIKILRSARRLTGPPTQKVLTASRGGVTVSNGWIVPLHRFLRLAEIPGSA
jgi:hypothetical protein